ncbi:MAG: autotransporter-associated beta strand repeat-containing protein, partial [Planctomycetia bacterium]
NARTYPNPVTIGGDVTIGGGTGSGSITFDAAVGLGGSTRILTVAADVTFSSAVSNGSLTKSGAGTLTLSASNSLTGTTTIAAGTLAIGNGGTTGSVAGNIANNAALTFNRSDAITYSGTISGTGSLVKQGAGSLTLSASNTFTGATTVAAGKLIVNGVLASSTTTVAAGAVLGGSGTISGAVIVGHSGTLSPGTSPGLLTVNSLLLSGSAVTRMEIVGSGSTAGAAGTAYDQVAVTSANALTFAGSLELDFGNRASLFPQGTTFQLFAFSGTAAGDFTTIRTVDTSGSYAGLTFTPSPYVTGEWTTGIIPGSASQYLVFSENTGRVVALPEPSAIAMAALGTGLAAWHAARRHRRRPAA